MLRRLAIAVFLLVTLLMGALGWILGRPGVLRPEAQVYAAPPNSDTTPSPGSVPSGGSELSVEGELAPSSAHAAHADARGE